MQLHGQKRTVDEKKRFLKVRGFKVTLICWICTLLQTRMLTFASVSEKKGKPSQVWVGSPVTNRTFVKSVQLTSRKLCKSRISKICSWASSFILEGKLSCTNEDKDAERPDRAGACPCPVFFVFLSSFAHASLSLTPRMLDGAQPSFFFLITKTSRCICFKVIYIPHVPLTPNYCNKPMSKNTHSNLAQFQNLIVYDVQKP